MRGPALSPGGVAFCDNFLRRVQSRGQRELSDRLAPHLRDGLNRLYIEHANENAPPNGGAFTQPR